MNEDSNLLNSKSNPDEPAEGRSAVLAVSSQVPVLISRNQSDIRPEISRQSDSIYRQADSNYSINAPRNNEDMDEGEMSALLSRHPNYGCVESSDSDASVAFKAQSNDHSKQHSVITIFSIWNTMMGTSILSMPWALGQAGFAWGIILMLFMAALALYTAYLVVRSPGYLAEETGKNVDGVEFSDVCRYYLGKWGENGSVVFFLIALLGPVIVYWVLMSNFLYNSVLFIYDDANHLFNMTIIGNQTNHDDVFCPAPGSPFDPSQNKTSTLFQTIWHPTHTVPFFLILFLAPLINFRSATFFTKFNALGTMSVVYMIVFITVKGFNWGFNMNFSHQDPLKIVIPEFLPTFPALTGILSLAYFIHNCILSILRQQRCPQNNGRDLSIAYGLVTLTYLFIGLVFYSCFPLAKSCIQDNLLNNFRPSDIMAFVGRICLFFQMLTVFPLLMFIFRSKVLSVLFGSEYPSILHVVIFNICVIVIALLFAVFYPKIGDIIGFAGSICGLVYMFALPCTVYMMYRYRRSTLTPLIVIFNIAAICVGLLNFIGTIVMKFIPPADTHGS